MPAWRLDGVRVYKVKSMNSKLRGKRRKTYLNKRAAKLALARRGKRPHKR